MTASMIASSWKSGSIRSRDGEIARLLLRLLRKRMNFNACSLNEVNHPVHRESRSRDPAMFARATIQRKPLLRFRGKHQYERGKRDKTRETPPPMQDSHTYG